MALMHIQCGPLIELPLIKEIGQLALTWNLATHGVYILFVGFSGMPAPLAAKAYFSLKADSAQRDMTQAMATHILSGSSDQEDIDLLARIKRVFKLLRKFSAVRNGAIHGILLSDRFGNVAADPYNRPSETQRKHELFNDPATAQSELERIIEELADVVNDCASHFSWPDTLLR